MPVFSSSGFTHKLYLSLLTLLAVSLPLTAQQKQPVFPKFELDAILTNLDHPWAMEIIAKDELLMTTKPGQLLLIKNAQVQNWIKGVPEVLNQGQGGLMDIALHPDYASNGWIYLSYAFQDGDQNATRIMRAKINDNRLVDQQVLFTAKPLKDTPVHYGARMVFLPDHSLIVSIGDGFDYREEAQRLDSQLGKLIRITDDGHLPADNPFVGQEDKDPYIWSYGHRNPQGLVYDAQRDILFSNEHGPAGGDEINIIEAGKNYGWPVITNGNDYSGAMISPYKTYPGMRLPFVDWTPSIAPSSMSVYRGELFPELKGDLLVTTLKTRELRWLKMKNNQVVKQKSLLRHLNERMRDIKIDAQGAIYLLTDGQDAKLLKLTRKNANPKHNSPAVTPIKQDAERPQ